jgi:hypothetical protein
MSLSSNVTLGGSSIDDNKSSSSTISYYYHVHKSQRTKKVLNPGSCASALNFMFDMEFDDSQQRGGSSPTLPFGSVVVVVTTMLSPPHCLDDRRHPLPLPLVVVFLIVVDLGAGSRH